MFLFKEVEYLSILSIPKLEIKAGEITCIVGESGGGKTTFLKLLNKLISPTKGDISYNGYSLADLDSVKHRQDVVMLSQKPYIFKGDLRVNLIKGLMIHKKEYNDQDLQDSLKRVKLEKPLDFDASKLSVGEAQRLALARVILLDASVYLLDEPSSALDEETEKIVIEATVNFVKEHKKTLVMVTHASKIAKQYGNTIFKFEKGFIKAGDYIAR
jgi:putative ABC transport system ATP-binding protein